MSSSRTHMATVLEKAASYIDALEAEIRLLSSDEMHDKIAQDRFDLEDLVSTITSVSGQDNADELRAKLSAATPDVRSMIRRIVGHPTNTDIGAVSEKVAQGSGSYEDDPDAAFLSWVTDQPT